MLLLILLTLAATDAGCDTASSCNRLGTEAYQASRFAEASALFDRQIDYAETAIERAEADDLNRLHAARDLAINNAALAQLRAGACLKARAYLDLARADARGTAANRRLLESRCGEALSVTSTTGQYWQYAGHGMWNSVMIDPIDSQSLHLSAWWMRVGMGPMDEFGVKAFGEFEQLTLSWSGATARGEFEGNDSTIACAIEVQFDAQAIEIAVTPDMNCHTGGAGAVLHGRYVLVSDRVSVAEVIE